MEIKEKTYSRPCPIHGQLLTTKRTKTIRTKRGEKYTKPFFYCSKCRAYYLIVDEFASDFKQKSLADSGTPIYILGKQKENKIKVEKNSLLKQYIIEDEILKITVIPRGTNLPKKCPNCQKDTHMVAFKAMAMGKVIKVLQGKRCSCCDMNFFPENLYKQNSEYFVITGQEKEGSNEKELAVVKNDSADDLGEIKIGTEETKVSLKSEKIEEVTLYTESMGTPQVEELINEEVDDRNDFNFQNGWKFKKKKYENVYNGPEAYLEAYQVKKCIVCGQPLNGDADTAWVQCDKCKAIYCEESYKHIFSEPVIIIGKRK